MTFEVNFDGLIGPTHHFAGLSFGNIASTSHKGKVSNPRAAALQGLEKMKLLMDAGLRQGVLPPVKRPDFEVLRGLGFSQNREKALNKLRTQPPEMISAFFSASSMWAANSATVSPSCDTLDGRVHFTPANLVSKFHRALEPKSMKKILGTVFASKEHFRIHAPITAHPNFGDEGAANVTRFCSEYGNPGLHFFVYGKTAFIKDLPAPKTFPARQTLEASQAVARLHGLTEDQTVFWQQNPGAIDAGAFHNDVVSVGNRDLLFYHEEAFLNDADLIGQLKVKFEKICKSPLRVLRVNSKDVPLIEAVKSYLFNSQLISLPKGEVLLLAPRECQENKWVENYLNANVGRSNSFISRVSFVNLRESMQNGGGPACLRLRVPLTKTELEAVHKNVLLTPSNYSALQVWIEKNYRDRLETSDLCDPKFIEEVETNFDELTQLLKLGSLYE
jgi:succinylarginine dihydrolase